MNKLERTSRIFAVIAGALFPVMVSAQWPTWTPSTANRNAAVTAEAAYWSDYHKTGISLTYTTYLRYIRPFAPLAGFMNASTTGMSFAALGPTLRWDSNHVPQITYDNGTTWQYNPVTVAHYGLYAQDSCLHGNTTDCTYFVNAADQLIAMMGQDGAFRYTFSYQAAGATVPYPPGWVSGMSQGQALSVFARAYLRTSDPKYLSAGTLAFQFLQTPVASGGVTGNLGDLNPALASYITLEEYPPAGTDKQYYTLNGGLYGLLGIYEWWMCNPDKNAAAGAYWQSALTSYKRMLRYYDTGGFTSYNLVHLTQPGKAPLDDVPYHNDHLALLNALAWATGDPVFAKYYALWKNYVDTQSPVRPIRGDVNGDGVVDQADVNLLQTLIGQPQSSWTLRQWAAGDLDDDGVLTNADVPLLQQLAGGTPN